MRNVLGFGCGWNKSGMPDTYAGALLHADGCVAVTWNGSLTVGAGHARRYVDRVESLLSRDVSLDSNGAVFEVPRSRRGVRTRACRVGAPADARSPARKRRVEKSLDT